MMIALNCCVPFMLDNSAASASRVLFAPRKVLSFPDKRLSSVKIKCYSENKVQGVLCYIDVNGEMICEGYDEGPRFHPPRQRPEILETYRRQDPHRFRWDADVMDLLQKNWAQLDNHEVTKQSLNFLAEDFKTEPL